VIALQRNLVQYHLNGSGPVAPPDVVRATMLVRTNCLARGYSGVRPAAAAFFDSLAQFYRRGYLRWIDATRRRPEQRAVRIAEMVELLESGIKQRT
jgi:Bacteriocin-protection, YdeI or OmpD-Associated/Aromatic amino acid lyase